MFVSSTSRWKSIPRIKGCLTAPTLSLLSHPSRIKPQNPKPPPREMELKTRARALSRSFLNSLMARVALNTRGMPISKLTVQIEGPLL